MSECFSLQQRNVIPQDNANDRSQVLNKTPTQDEPNRHIRTSHTHRLPIIACGHAVLPSHMCSLKSGACSLVAEQGEASAPSDAFPSASCASSPTRAHRSGGPSGSCWLRSERRSETKQIHSHKHSRSRREISASNEARSSRSTCTWQRDLWHGTYQLRNAINPACLRTCVCGQFVLALECLLD